MRGRETLVPVSGRVEKRKKDFLLKNLNYRNNGDRMADLIRDAVDLLIERIKSGKAPKAKPAKAGARKAEKKTEISTMPLEKFPLCDGGYGIIENGVRTQKWCRLSENGRCIRGGTRPPINCPKLTKGEVVAKLAKGKEGDDKTEGE